MEPLPLTVPQLTTPPSPSPSSLPEFSVMTPTPAVVGHVHLLDFVCVHLLHAN